MPFRLGVPELLIILLIIFIIFGAGKLPQIFDALGKGVNKLRNKAAKDTKELEEQEKAEEKAEIKAEEKPAAPAENQSPVQDTKPETPEKENLG